MTYFWHIYEFISYQMTNYQQDYLQPMSSYSHHKQAFSVLFWTFPGNSVRIWAKLDRKLVLLAWNVPPPCSLLAAWGAHRPDKFKDQQQTREPPQHAKSGPRPASDHSACWTQITTRIGPYWTPSAWPCPSSSAGLGGPRWASGSAASRTAEDGTPPAYRRRRGTVRSNGTGRSGGRTGWTRTRWPRDTVTSSAGCLKQSGTCDTEHPFSVSDSVYWLSVINWLLMFDCSSVLPLLPDPVPLFTPADGERTLVHGLKDHHGPAQPSSVRRQPARHGARCRRLQTGHRTHRRRIRTAHRTQYAWPEGNQHCPAWGDLLLKRPHETFTLRPSPQAPPKTMSWGHLIWGQLTVSPWWGNTAQDTVWCRCVQIWGPAGKTPGNWSMWVMFSSKLHLRSEIKVMLLNTIQTWLKYNFNLFITFN